jgi:hypothetical protein
LAVVVAWAELQVMTHVVTPAWVIAFAGDSCNINTREIDSAINQMRRINIHPPGRKQPALVSMTDQQIYFYSRMLEIAWNDVQFSVASFRNRLFAPAFFR